MALGEVGRMIINRLRLTQEQLAEILLVSGRTVSRWETGTNMPDLSVLIQMAEFYGVEIKEILDGERKSEIMDK
ncbi:MAG: helix-turn-helix transcriptional regulator, partial [Oribacterium sp.]|nr:helix-turn-helix transcriptional regulator [Oribacterium sp.]